MCAIHVTSEIATAKMDTTDTCVSAIVYQSDIKLGNGIPTATYNPVE